MSWSCCEPTLAEILSDPIVAAVMAADAVDVRELDMMLSQIARGLHAAEDPPRLAGTKSHRSPLTKQQAPRSSAGHIRHPNLWRSGG
jgi:hypothetical protein